VGTSGSAAIARAAGEPGVSSVSTWVGSGVPRFYLPLDQIFPQPNVSQAIVLEELSESVGCGGKTSGDAHAVGQLRDHFAKAGVLAADDFNVLVAQLLEGDDQCGRLKAVGHESSRMVKNLAVPCLNPHRGLEF